MSRRSEILHLKTEGATDAALSRKSSSGSRLWIVRRGQEAPLRISLQLTKAVYPQGGLVDEHYGIPHRSQAGIDPETHPAAPRLPHGIGHREPTGSCGRGGPLGCGPPNRPA